MSANMPISFTGQYLYSGAKNPLLGSELPYKGLGFTYCSPLRGIARFIYAQGVATAATCGVFYHTLAAAECRGESLFRSNNDVKEQLKERCWQHLNASYFDLCAFGSYIKYVVMSTILVATPILLVTEPWSAGLHFLAVSIFCLFGLKGYDNVVYNFLASPLAFDKYLSKEVDAKTHFSQSDRYQVELFYKVIDRQLNLSKEPLTDELIYQLTKFSKEIESLSAIEQYEKPKYLMFFFGLSEILLKANRIPATRVEEIKYLLSKKEALFKAHKSSMNFAVVFSNETDNNKKLLKYGELMVQEMDKIFKDSPQPVDKSLIPLGAL